MSLNKNSDQTEKDIKCIANDYQKQPSENKDGNVSKGFDFILKSAAFFDVGKKIYQMGTFKNTFKLMDDLAHVVKNFSQSQISKIKDISKNIGDTEIKEICEEICRTKKVNCTEIITKIENSKEAMANKIIRNSAITSFVLITIQVAKIYCVWKDLKRASNVAEESKKKFPEIQANIIKLNEGMAEINATIELYEKENDKQEKRDLAEDINTTVGQMNTIYAETIALLSDVKLVLGNTIERLDLRCTEQTFDGFSNAVQAIANLVQFISLDGIASKGMHFVQGMVTSAYFGLAMANFGTVLFTKDMLVELRKSMAVVREFEKQLMEIKKQLDIVHLWLKDLRQKRRQARKSARNN